MGDLPSKLWWANVQYIGITGAPLLFLVFALQYTSAGRRPTVGQIAALSVVPVITSIPVWTNDVHGP